MNQAFCFDGSKYGDKDANPNPSEYPDQDDSDVITLARRWAKAQVSR